MTLGKSVNRQRAPLFTEEAEGEQRRLRPPPSSWLTSRSIIRTNTLTRTTNTGTSEGRRRRRGWGWAAAGPCLRDLLLTRGPLLSRLPSLRPTPETSAVLRTLFVLVWAKKEVLGLRSLLRVRGGSAPGQANGGSSQPWKQRVGDGRRLEKGSWGKACKAAAGGA